MADQDPRRSTSLLAETEEFLGIHHNHHNHDSNNNNNEMNNDTFINNSGDIHKYTSESAPMNNINNSNNNNMHTRDPAAMKRPPMPPSYPSEHLTPPPSPPSTNATFPTNRTTDSIDSTIEDSTSYHQQQPQQHIRKTEDAEVDDTVLAKGVEAHPATEMIPEVPHEEKGEAQLNHADVEVKDLGWNETASINVASPMLGGVRNEEVWTLVRRFNKVMYHVRMIDHVPPGGLDLHGSPDEEFSPDKLRANLERFYITVVVGVVSAAKQIARLRSWSERRRTGTFCAVYFAAWALNVVGPLLLFTMFALVIFPRARKVMFPPAPLALTSAKTGEVSQPRAGMLGSGDSLTGAAQQHEGEAVEQEAEQFVSGFANIAISSAIGKHPAHEAAPAEVEIHPETKEKVVHDDKTATQKAEGAAPDPAATAMKAINAKESASGEDTEGKDKVKKDMNEAMWEKARPAMMGLEAATDVWEMFQNALEPTPPFHKHIPRLKLGGVLLPAALASIFVTPAMIARGTWLILGIVFFTDPLASKALNWLNTHYPNWMEMLDLRNTLLKGVPTNAQLTLTLLRIGEANRSPLPPPPGDLDESHAAPSTSKTMNVDASELPMDDVTHAEVQNAIQSSPEDLAKEKSSEEHDNEDEENKKKTGKGHKFMGAIVGMFKGTTKGGVTAALATNKARANLGSVPAKQRLGVVPNKDADTHKKEELMETVNGPVEFPCRYRGHTGKAYLITHAASPCLSFAPDGKAAKKHDGSVADDSITADPEGADAVWSIPVAKIREVKKIGGLGWKGKMVVGWSMNRQVVDGLEIVYEPEHSMKPKAGGFLHHHKEEEKYERKVLTAVVERDGLFNRLISMGGQKWESL